VTSPGTHTLARTGADVDNIRDPPERAKNEGLVVSAESVVDGCWSARVGVARGAVSRKRRWTMGFDSCENGGVRLRGGAKETILR